MNWLRTELLTGFQKLLCLGLDRTPATEIIPGTLQAWLEVFAGRDWNEAQDVPRVRGAFLTLATTRRNWPTPADFLEAMPPRSTEWKALPKTASDPERAKAEFAKVMSLLGVRDGAH